MYDLPLQYNTLLISRTILTRIGAWRRILIVVGIGAWLRCIAWHHIGTSDLSEVHLHPLLIEIRVGCLIERLIIDLYRVR